MPVAVALRVACLPGMHNTMSLSPCNPSTWEVKAKGSKVQDHLWLHQKLEASLSCMRPSLKRERGKGKQGNKEKGGQGKGRRRKERRGREGREERMQELLFSLLGVAAEMSLLHQIAVLVLSNQPTSLG